MIHILMDINEHQDQKCTWGDNVGRDLYLLGVNVLVETLTHYTRKKPRQKHTKFDLIK